MTVKASLFRVSWRAPMLAEVDDKIGTFGRRDLKIGQRHRADSKLDPSNLV